MKIEDVAYALAGETLAVLEQKYHYRIPEEHKRDIQRTVRENFPGMLAKMQQPEPAEESETPKAAEAEAEQA